MKRGQILLPESLGNLTYSGGAVLLASSILNLGGMQYVTDQSQISLSGLVANTVYYVYMVNVNETLSLVYSTSSTGPNGYLNYKYIGKFKTDSGGLFSYFGDNAPYREYYFEATTSGNFTVPAGVYSVDVEGIAGGGGGASANGPVATSGGGGGAAVKGRKTFAVTPGQVIPYVVGAPGSSTNGGTNAYGAGGPGGDTSFNGVVISKGGPGGAVASSGGQGIFAAIGRTRGGNGGNASSGAGITGGDSSLYGEYNPGSWGGAGTNWCAGAPGAASEYGHGANSGASPASNAYGAGGGGGATSNPNYWGGMNGASGYIKIMWIGA